MKGRNPPGGLFQKAALILPKQPVPGRLIQTVRSPAPDSATIHHFPESTHFLEDSGWIDAI
jgi:hypothetical protein